MAWMDHIGPVKNYGNRETGLSTRDLYQVRSRHPDVGISRLQLVCAALLYQTHR
jgi:hypothetical protein